MDPDPALHTREQVLQVAKGLCTVVGAAVAAEELSRLYGPRRATEASSQIDVRCGSDDACRDELAGQRRQVGRAVRRRLQQAVVRLARAFEER